MSALVQPAYRHDLVAICCYRCGIEFAVPRHWNTKRHEDKESFWCPNGHSQMYSGETEEQRRIRELERQVAHEKSSREWAESQQRSANIRRGKAEAARKRLEKRVHAGVCPHCQRTFSQLARHMETQHSALIAETT